MVLVVLHRHPVRPPVLALVFLIVVVREGLQQRVLAVVEFDLLNSIFRFVPPDDLPRVPGVVVSGIALYDCAFQITTPFVAQPAVLVPVHFLRSEVFVGEFAAYERSRLVAGRNPLHPSQRREVQPLIVGLQDARVREQGRPLDVPRRVENQDALVAAPFFGAFQRSAPQHPRALLSASVPEHHLHDARVVVPAVILAVGFLRDRPTFLLRGLCGAQRRHHHHTGDDRCDCIQQCALHVVLSFDLGCVSWLAHRRCGGTRRGW